MTLNTNGNKTIENKNDKTSPEDTITKLKEIDSIPINSNEITVEEKNLAETSWSKCLKIIQDNVSVQVYRTWFEPIKALKLSDSQLTVKVPSQFFCEWIEEHFYPLLQKTLVQVIGENAKLQYEIVFDESTDTLEQRTIKVQGIKYPPGTNQVQLPFAQNPFLQQEYPTFLTPRFTFDNFIRGESNQLAVSACLAVSQNPGGTRFNPLVIYSDTGLGKTHLVQATGNAIVSRFRKSRVIYTSSERFTMEFVNAIQNNKVNEFISFYRSVDVLIVDDIHFFSGKEKTQDNFFHTFNALHQSGKQIILTSDKPPRSLVDVDERLISRFQWGLTTDIQPPDFEMRMAIIKRKSKDEGFDLPQNIVEYLAKYVINSIRELEGVLISLLAKVSLDRRELNLELAKEVVYGVTNFEPINYGIDDIKDAVSQYTKIPIEQMESKSRKHEVAFARQMSMFLAKQLTTLSLKSIGSHFGNRDHSTVLHSCQTIQDYIDTDKKVKATYELLLKKFKRD